MSLTQLPAVQTLVLLPLRRWPGTVEALSSEAFASLSGVAEFNRTLRRRGIWSGIGKILIEFEVNIEESIGIVRLTVRLLVVEGNKFNGEFRDSPIPQSDRTVPYEIRRQKSCHYARQGLT
jgi:hypothetical protein